MKKILEYLGRAFVLTLLVTRCATQTDSGSQTHWLATCSQDADCGAGLVCRCGLCTKTCTGDACSDLPRPATCVSPSSAAHAALCATPPNDAICLARCGSGCLSDERCIDGACVPLRAALPDGGRCTGGETLVYETPGCDAKPVCDGPNFDACAMQACGCDGISFWGGCGVFDKPFAHTGPCVAGVPEAGRGRWMGVGVPCEKCDFQDEIARNADPTPEDCGRVPVDAGDAGRAAAADCAYTAFQAGRPFSWIVEQGGTDSSISTGWIFAQGRFYEYHYDSNVCGGGPSCETVGCGPSLERRVCAATPVASPASRTIQCSSWSDWETICAPDQTCNAGVCP